MDWQLERAKQICQQRGYRVIHTDRVRKLTVTKSISIGLLENMQAMDVPGFRKHCDEVVGRQMGSEMMHAGAITKTDIGGVPYEAVQWRYEGLIIMPRNDLNT